MEGLEYNIAVSVEIVEISVRNSVREPLRGALGERIDGK